MSFPAAVSASPLAVLVDRDVLRSALGRDVEADLRARARDAAIIEGLVDSALDLPVAREEGLDLDRAPEPLRWHGVMLLVAVAASIVIVTLAV